MEEGKEMSENETKKTISLWRNSNSEFIARVDRKTGKTQRLAHHANHVSALMALYTDWPEMVHAMSLICASYVAEKFEVGNFSSASCWMCRRNFSLFFGRSVYILFMYTKGKALRKKKMPKNLKKHVATCAT